MGSRSGSRWSWIVVLAATVLFVIGCSSDSAPADDAKPKDSSGKDSSIQDSGVDDVSTPDTTEPDSGPQPDTTVPDTTPPVDTSVPSDSTSIDLPAAPSDAALADIVIVDAAPPPPGCGNGIRENAEECDDGNTTNLDGCSSGCTFEQVHRINSLVLQYGTSSFCPFNGFGAAIAAQLAQDQLQTSLDNGIADGEMNMLMHFLALDDLSGTNDPLVVVGMLDAAPVAGAGYNGANDLDWWYTVSSQSLNANRMPLEQMNGNITANVLSLGPSALTLPVDLGGSGASMLPVSHARIRATLGAVDSPTTSSGTSPGHLAAENLDPLLLSFARAGSSSAGATGDLCGNVSAAALATVPVPDALTGALGCQQGYTPANNSLLDVIVGGCDVLIIEVITPTQPDSHDPRVPPVGAGPLYTLSANGQGVVDGCTDKSGQTVALNDCLQDAAYSISFKFSSGRVIGK